MSDLNLDSMAQTVDFAEIDGPASCPVQSPRGEPCRKTAGHHGAHKFRDYDRTEYDRQRRERIKAERGSAAPRPQEARADAAPVEIDPAVVDMLWGVVGATAATLARARGATVDEAEILRITDEELSALRKPTVAVLQKHAASLGRWGDEIALAVVAGALVTNKMAAFRTALARRSELAAPASRYP